MVTTRWARAANVQSLHLRCRREPVLDYEIQVLRIGPLAIVGLPGEPFVELGLKIKTASPTYPTYIAHCTSHYVGYIPTQAAYESAGGIRPIPGESIDHEVRDESTATIVRDIDDTILEAAAAGKLLSEVGVPWAVPSVPFELEDYEAFPQRWAGDGGA